MGPLNQSICRSSSFSKSMRPSQLILVLTAQFLSIIPMIFASPSLLGGSEEERLPTTELTQVEGLLQSRPSRFDCTFRVNDSGEGGANFMPSKAHLYDKQRVKTGYMPQVSFTQAKKAPKRKADHLELKTNHENFHYTCPDLNLPPIDLGYRSDNDDLSVSDSYSPLLTMHSKKNGPAGQLPNSSNAPTHADIERHPAVISKILTQKVDERLGNIVEVRGTWIKSMGIPAPERRTIDNQDSQVAGERSESPRKGLSGSEDCRTRNIKYTSHPQSITPPSSFGKFWHPQQRYEISPAVLGSIILPYEKELKGLFCTFPSENHSGDRIPFKDMRLFQVMYFNKTTKEALPMTRLGYGATRLQSYATTQSRIKPLIRWLTHYHSILSFRFGTPAKQVDQSLKWLLDWLLQDVFQQGVPVTGIVTTPIQSHDESVFQPVQIHLIKYLTSDRYLFRVQETALIVLAIWYKSQEPDIWDKLFLNDSHFWSFLSSTIKEETNPRRVCTISGEKNEPSIMYRSHSRKFDIIKFEPQPVLRFSYQILKVEQANLADQLTEENFIKPIRDIYLFKRSNGYADRIQIDETSAVAIPLRCGSNDSDLYIIRFAMAGNSKGISENSGKTMTLLSHLKAYHKALLSGIKLEELEIQNHDLFLKWFWRQCFDPGPGRGLPIFGIFKGPLKSQKSPHFGPLQAHLIEHYSRNDSRNTLASTTVSILRHWYKTERKQFWEDYFVNDYLFSSIMKKFYNKN